jgi:hypothetical protein
MANLTIRRAAQSTVLPAGTELTLTDRRNPAHGVPMVRVFAPQRATHRAEPATPSATTTETAAVRERRFDDALAVGDAATIATAILPSASERPWIHRPVRVVGGLGPLPTRRLGSYD